MSLSSLDCPEVKELRKFLKSCFDQTDKDAAGLIGIADADEMCERLGAAPRELSDASLTSETYACDAERIRARGEMFDDWRAPKQR